MDINKRSYAELIKKQISMVDYLAAIKIQPAYKRGNNYWYYSPFHDEHTPSFKVNMNINCWIDFSTGQKGNLIDFGILYHKCDASQFLSRISSMDLNITHIEDATGPFQKKKKAEENKIIITQVRDLFLYPLLNYFQKRGIPQKIAREYCQEVHYSLGDKNYYAIGFKNDAGGYELRNDYIKASSSPKGSTFIDNGADEVAVFEGFFNFLSYKTMLDGKPESNRNYLILNSCSFFDQQLPKMQAHKHCHLYLDNDKTGSKFTEKALAINPGQFNDERHLYQGKKDLNEWLTTNGHRLHHTHILKR